MKHFFLLLVALLNLNANAQDTKKDADAVKTKMDAFASKTGTITKFVDFKLTGLKTTYGNVENRIRKVSNSTSSAYFFQIEKEGKYGSTTASVEFSDLIEVLKAIKALKESVANDISSNPDYMENKFTTVDGFQIGYYVNNGKATWYIKLEKYGSDNTIFLNNGDIIEEAFNSGKAKIDELKK
ncbi:MAG: hypothetical protein EOO99_11835 [Pedobacter sp.]|nr:MAG: hypothetical protein EOO99_11835 [Pedobacter sp.]